MENELIKITTNDEGVNCVSARELHEELEVTERFQQWFDKRVKKYGFEENIDFTGVKNFTLVNNGAKRELQDYAITLDMAKELCMVQNNELGRKFRKYFIEKEKELRELKRNNIPMLTPEQQLQFRILNGENGMERTVALAEYKDFLTKPLIVTIEEKDDFIDNVIGVSEKCISFADFSRLTFDKYGLGRNKLISTLRELRVLKKNNTPYQQFMNNGYFEVEEGTINGKLCLTTRVTPKGQEWLVKKLNKWQKDQTTKRERRIEEEKSWGIIHKRKED